MRLFNGTSPQMLLCRPNQMLLYIIVRLITLGYTVFCSTQGCTSIYQLDHWIFFNLNTASTVSNATTLPYYASRAVIWL